MPCASVPPKTSSIVHNETAFLFIHIWGLVYPVYTRAAGVRSEWVLTAHVGWIGLAGQLMAPSRAKAIAHSQGAPER
jgi:hypothetical protein